MGRKSLTCGALGGIGLVALLLRAVDFRSVFAGHGWVIFPGHDPYYHLRRIELILQDWPWVPYFDGAMNYPRGAPVIWPPLFDFFCATLCKLGGLGPGDLHAVETVSAWLIPVLGSLTVVPVYFLARRALGRPEALLAASMLALCPAHLWYSRLGFVDHHTAATLLQVLLILAAVRALQSPRVPFLPLALVLVAGMLTWNGFLLYIGLLDAGLLLLIVLPPPERRESVARLAWQSHVAAAVLLAPFAAISVGATASPFSAVTFSWFHVLALLLVGLVAAACDPGQVRSIRTLSAMLAAGLVVFVVFRADVLRQGAGWVLTRDPFMSRVNESLPLIHLYREAGSEALRLSLPSSVTWFHFLFPVAWIAWLLDQMRSRFRIPTAALLVLVWSGGIWVLALLQRRFLEALAPALAILVASLLPRARRFSRPVAATVVVVALLLAFAPWHAGWLTGRRRPDVEYDAALYEALDRFRADRLGREQRGFFPSASPDGPGAVNPWPLGHKILYITGLPVVSNNFGSHIGVDSYRDWAAFFVAGDEERAADLLRDRDVRYVFLDDDLESFRAALQVLDLDEEEFFRWRPGPQGTVRAEVRRAFLLSMYHRMIGPAGAELVLPDVEGAALEVPALGRFRLLQAPDRDGRGRLRVFERVPGARIRLRGEPGERVRLVYPLAESEGRRRQFRTTVLVDERGFAEALVPYPSDLDDRGWSSPYRVTAGSDTMEVRVTERSIQRNETILIERPSL